ncbi:MAG: CBS domain-containing protein [Chitinophagaceae bacterium]|nr:CBS domain-containing protein [Chitinophagaceae bacterium]
MTCLQLADQNLPVLSPEDTVVRALKLMDGHTCNGLPVISENKYKGLIERGTLLNYDEDPETKIKELLDELKPVSIHGSNHFLKSVPLVKLYRTNVIPVVNEEGDYQGSITHLDLIQALGNFSGAGEYGALIVLAVEQPKLIFSELNTIMESDGATILHYNVSPIAASSVMEVTIGLDKKEISTIIASLERYNYTILFTSGEDMLESQLEDNYNNLMNYLDI